MPTICYPVPQQEGQEGQDGEITSASAFNAQRRTAVGGEAQRTLARRAHPPAIPDYPGGPQGARDPGGGPAGGGPPARSRGGRRRGGRNFVGRSDCCRR